MNTETKIEQLQAENKKLREALAPFAAMGQPSSMDGWSDGDDPANVTLAQCRNAYQVLKSL